MVREDIRVSQDWLEDFCRRWQIVELSVFGSALREDFRPDSDIDVLVTFEPGGGITFGNRVEMLDELAAIFGRKVDLVEKSGLRNPFRRRHILNHRQVIYAG